MCRVFGFRSAMESGVHQSLLRARNALTVQSRAHPDGWGIATFDAAGPRVERGTGAAFADGDFSRAVDLVASQTVVAHVRKASCGEVTEENCHPFVRGRWAFAHNGDIARWDAVRAEVERRVAPRWRDHVGETDSERCFGLFLTELARDADPEDPDLSFERCAEALRAVAAGLRALADPGAEKPSVLTFVATNGPVLVALHEGNTLWYSTHKARCPERRACPLRHAACEAAVAPGSTVRHLLVASEPLGSENVWQPVPGGAVVGVDGEMTFRVHGAPRAAAPRALGLGI